MLKPLPKASRVHFGKSPLKYMFKNVQQNNNMNIFYHKTVSEKEYPKKSWDI